MLVFENEEYADEWSNVFSLLCQINYFALNGKRIPNKNWLMSSKFKIPDNLFEQHFIFAIILRWRKEGDSANCDLKKFFHQQPHLFFGLESRRAFYRNLDNQQNCLHRLVRIVLKINRFPSIARNIWLTPNECKSHEILSGFYDKRI